MAKILIIEDDEKLKIELKIFLENNGFEVETIDNFSNTLDDMLKKESDLILLDISLPNFNGQYLCKEFRKTSQTPIIIITSKDTELDELISINYGADDFVTKPFNLSILLARMENVLKRVGAKVEVLNYKNLKLNISKSQIETQEKTVDLSKNELKIFHYLLKNKGKIISREEIMSYLWDSEEFIDDNTLTVNINRLRNKLLELGLDKVIETKRGQGYMLNED